MIGVLRHQRLDGDEDGGDALGWAPCRAGPCPTHTITLCHCDEPSFMSPLYFGDPDQM